MRWLLVGLVLAAPAAFACSLIAAPYASTQLAAGESPPGEASSTDTVAPGAVTVGAPTVHLVRNGCDGSGAACPQLDRVEFSVAASDDQTGPDELRYLAAFGATEAEATTAAGSLLFKADLDDTARVTAYLGFGGARSGRDFSRATLCFTLAAVDVAGNVGPRSSPRCVDTVSEAGAQVTDATPCGGTGCASAPANALLAVLVLFARRRARVA